MSKNAELAKAIESFISKYWGITEKLGWPKWESKIVGVGQVKIDDNSLKEIGDLWTFKGAAHIIATDISQVKMNSAHTIIGNAKVVFYPNAVNHEEQLPEVKQVVITKI